MKIDDFLSSNKYELLSYFGQVHAAKSVELLIDTTKDEDEEFLKKCCLDAVTEFRHGDGEFDFPISKKKESSELDRRIAGELYIITLCEEEVKSGLLKRSGFRYSLVNNNKMPNIPNKKKYIVPPSGF